MTASHATGARPSRSSLEAAASLMAGFAERTGLSSRRPPRRYLWTDAFAVCTFLGLDRVTGEERYTELALRLVDQVHETLGRHRPDDPRFPGWLSGPHGAADRAHPTRGGLRIGKALPGRGPDEPLDPDREWDRDGQYFHYLTRWMHALDQVARATGQALFNRWARELAQAAHAAFTTGSPEGGQRMVWKMSIDLSQVLVPSMGQHDPLDGFLTCAELDTTANLLPGPVEGPDLEAEATAFAAMTEAHALITGDPLGIGGLLTDASRIAQLTGRGVLPPGNLLAAVLGAALAGLEGQEWQRQLEQPAGERVAFREIGLAIGLAAARDIEPMVQREPDRLLRSDELVALLERLARFAALGPTIESFWLEPAHQSTEAWSAHRDISDVMLATCLVPEGAVHLAGIE